MILERFRAISSHPLKAVREEKAKDKKIIAYLMADFPEEIVHAAGAVPFLLTGGSSDISRAESHLQAYACSISRRSLAWALNGELDFVDGMVIPIICDTTRCLAYIWKNNCPIPFFERLLLPRTRSGQSVRSYLVNELCRLKKRLEGFLAVEISAEALRRSISIYDENRKLLQELYKRREENRLGLSNADFYDVVRSSFIIPKEVHNLWLKELLDGVKDEETERGRDNRPIRIFLSGKLAEPRDLFLCFDELGCLIVKDDFWNGFSFFSREVHESRDPLETLALSLLSRGPLSVFIDPAEKRYRGLVEKAKAHSIEGAVFIYPKYCDPMAFDYPEIQTFLRKEGIPSLFVELEFDHSFQTRLQRHLEVFVEMLGRRGSC